ncbi:MAG TPA: chorismate mutase, partial [Thermoguttaceae bacterium]
MAKSKPKPEADNAAKKKTARRSESAGLPSNADIARVDRELLRLIQRRASLVLEASKASDAIARQTLASSLVGERLKQLADELPGPLPPRCVESIIRELLSGCRSLVKQSRIAFMGPMYSYSHLAAIHRFGQSVEFVPVG